MNQMEIIRALFGGIGGQNGMELYKQEQPKDLLTGQPYLSQPSLSPTMPTKGQISPALAGRNATMTAFSPQGVVNNQAQLGSKEALAGYDPSTAITGTTRKKDENIQDYVKRLLANPTGAGELSNSFMDSWAKANQSLPKNKEETVGQATMGGGDSQFSPSVPVPTPSMGNFGNNLDANRNAVAQVFGGNNNMMGDFDVSGGGSAVPAQSSQSGGVFSPPTTTVKNNPLTSFFQTSQIPDPNAQPTDEQRKYMALLAGFDPYFRR